MAYGITLGGIKGGSGKTTIATSLATMNTQNNILMVDADPQESLHDWGNVRSNNESLTQIEIVKKTGSLNLGAFSKTLKKYDLAIIDTGGRDSIEFQSSLLLSDLLITPLKASFYDYATIENLIKRYEQAKIYNEKLKWVAVINQINPSTNIFKGALEQLKEMLSNYAFVHNQPICSRISYINSSNEGKGINETTDEKGIAEFNQFFNTIQKQL